MFYPVHHDLIKVFYSALTSNIRVMIQFCDCWTQLYCLMESHGALDSYYIHYLMVKKTKEGPNMVQTDHFL